MARLSTERAALRWIILTCVWVLVAALAIADAVAVRDYVALLDDSGTLPVDSLPLRRPAPAPYADAQTWTRLALASDTTGSWQIRHTTIDDAPQGRAVHWNSAFVHLIAAAGQVRSATLDEPLPMATERALAWINVPLLILTVVLFSSWISVRVGAAGGALVSLGMIGHRWFYDGFAPNYVDHHGLLTAATFGCVLGAMFIPRPQTGPGSDARAGVILSAICGGIGLWVSAASVIPTIAAVGVAAAIVAWARDDDSTIADASREADLWRLWSRIGAMISIVAYLIEYAPSHLGMRLEVNHPLYAFAWLGGGELIAMIVGRRAQRSSHRGGGAQEGREVNGARQPPLWKVAGAIVMVAAPLVVIVAARSRVFLPLDPTVARLHDYIDEFASLPGLIGRSGWSSFGRYVIALALLLPALLVVRERGRRPRLLFVSIVAVALASLGVWEIRWWLPASGAELCLLVVALSVAGERWSAHVRWIVVAIIGAVFVEQSIARIALTRHNVAVAGVTNADAMQPLFRDVAVALRRSQPAGAITLLSSPDASSAISYFGGFRSIGTFYWENRDGLAAAAGMLAASSDDSAFARIQARGVTHVALFSSGNFLDAYLHAVKPDASPGDLRDTFGSRVLFQGQVPHWLRAIPFVPRPGSPSRVLLFQVVSEQSEFDALWAQGIALAAAGDESSSTVLERAVAMAPSEQRAGLLGDAARETYRWRAHRVALTLFERSLSLERSPATLLAIGWLLATSPDDAVRDGPRAVALVEPLSRAAPEAGGVLDTYAAALAEAGRFDQAISAEVAAVGNARRQGDAAAVVRGEDRLRAYRAGRPWRQ